MNAEGITDIFFRVVVQLRSLFSRAFREYLKLEAGVSLNELKKYFKTQLGREFNITCREQNNLR